MCKIIFVIKMRGGNNSKDIREYIIDAHGVFIINPRSIDCSQMRTGLPIRKGHQRLEEDEVPPEPKAPG